MKREGKLDVVEVKRECYEALHKAYKQGKIPKEAVIKNHLKGGGIIRYKTDRDMLTLCVTDYKSDCKTRNKIKASALTVIKRLMKKHNHINICVN